MGCIDRIVKKELKKKKKAKVLLGNSLYSVTSDMEFAKWLKYETVEEKNILALPIETLTLDQIEELKKINERRIYSRIFNKYAYNLEECSNEEYIVVYDYMKTHFIEDLMEERLTPLELSYAKDKIAKIYISFDSKQLNSYLDSFNTVNDKDAYKNMDIIDSYIFHYLSKTFIESKMKSTNNTIEPDVKIYTLNNLCYKAN